MILYSTFQLAKHFGDYVCYVWLQKVKQKPAGKSYWRIQVSAQHKEELSNSQSSRGGQLPPAVRAQSEAGGCR